MNFQYEDKLITIYFTDRQLDDFMEDYNMEGQYLKEYMNKNNIPNDFKVGNLLVFRVREHNNTETDNPIIIGYVDKDNIELIHLKAGPFIEEDIPRRLLERYSVKEIINKYKVPFRILTKEETENEFGY